MKETVHKSSGLAYVLHFWFMGVAVRNYRSVQVYYFCVIKIVFTCFFFAFYYFYLLI